MNKVLLAIMTFIFISCLPEKATDTLIFSGSIDSPNSKAIILSRDGYEKEISLEEDGTFKLLLTDITEGIYTLWDSVESTSLYLIPGKDLHLTLNTELFDESIKYSGQDPSASNYLAAKFLYEEGLDINYKGLFSNEEADFLEEVNKIENQMLQFLNSVDSIPDKLVEFEKLNFFFEKLSLIKDYQGAHAYYTGQPDFTASALLNEYLTKIDYTNDSLYAILESYKRLVINHYTGGSFEQNLAQLDSLKSSRIKRDVLYDLLYFMRPGAENLDQVFKGLSKHALDEDYKADLVNLYEKYKELAKGKPSPSFSYEDTEGNMVNLKDLKGKLVYIDVWATWCSPCIAEIPNLKKLESDYQEKSISFVSISIDRMDAKEKWLKMIEEKELKGIQLFADRDWNSNFIQAYGIQGIPRFILLDHNGNIISADAPRPSSGKKLRDLIDESLAKIN